MTKRQPELGDMDRFYLEHQGMHLIHSANRKTGFLGLFVLINLAFYCAVYLLSPENIWAFTNLKLFLAGVLFLVNSAFYIINNRQQEMTKVLKENFYQLIRKMIVHPDINQMMMRLSDNDKNKGLSSKVINWLLSFFSAVPIAFFITLFTYMIYPHVLQLNILFLLTTVIFTAVYYFKVP